MKIWIDLANSPQVLFFRPLVAEFRRRGHDVSITARDFAQTVALANRYDLDIKVVGEWTTRKSVVDKAVRAASRVARLYRYALGQRFDLAVSHGSHMQIAAAWLLCVPAIMVADYEGNPASGLSVKLASRVVVPEVLGPVERAKYQLPASKVRTYPGIKEDVYLADFRPDPGFTASLPVPWDERIVAVVRPPGTGVYQHFEHPFFSSLMAYLASQPDVFIVLLPRYPRQGEELKATVLPRAWIPPDVVDGPQLVYHADLVISAVGTMNREAAVLGTPAYSVFVGEVGAVDRHLVQTGRLVHINCETDFQRIRLEKHQRVSQECYGRPELLTEVADLILGQA